MSGVQGIANRAIMLASANHQARVKAANNARVAAISLASVGFDVTSQSSCAALGTAMAAADATYFAAVFASTQQKQRSGMRLRLPPFSVEKGTAMLT
jgi:hypothetical protein